MRAIGQKVTSQVSPLQGPLPAEVKRREGTELDVPRVTSRLSVALLCPSCPGGTPTLYSLPQVTSAAITWPQVPKMK